MSAALTSRNTSNLCTYCNMCCNGMIFGKVNITHDEFRKLGGGPEFLPQDNGEGRQFLQKCIRLGDNGACSKYVDRPNACRNFNCELLKKVTAGEVKNKAAIQIVNEAKTLHQNCMNTARSIVPNELWPASCISGSSATALVNILIKRGYPVSVIAQQKMYENWNTYNNFIRNNFSENTFSKTLNFPTKE